MNAKMKSDLKMIISLYKNDIFINFVINKYSVNSASITRMFSNLI